MPQADEELRKEMVRRFGSIGTTGPSRFLTDAGYQLAPGWEWVPKPGVRSLGQMPRDEFECLLFLIHEWDYGGLIEQPSAALEASRTSEETE